MYYGEMYWCIHMYTDELYSSPSVYIAEDIKPHTAVDTPSKCQSLKGITVGLGIRCILTIFTVHEEMKQ